MDHDYIIEYKDFLNAQKLYLKHKRGANLRLKAWLYGLPAITLLLLITDLHAFMTNQAGMTAILSGFAGFGLWMTLIIVGLRPWKLRRFYRKLLPPGEKKLMHARFSFSAEGVISSVPGRSEGRFYWSAIQDFAEDEKMALLFFDKKKFLFIPKRAMAPSDWDNLQTHLQFSPARS